MAEAGRRDGDGLDDLVLDEEFVRRATTHELDARQRQRAKAKADRRERRLFRRHARRRIYTRVAQSTLLLAGVVGVLAAAGWSGKGPLAMLQPAAEPEPSSALVASSSNDPDDPLTSTTTTVVLESRSYKVGDCVVWDELVQHASENETKVVSCDAPHLMEVTGSFVLPRGPYPSEAEWDAMFDTGRCAEIGAAYLGGHLDPRGAYGPRGIIPLRDSWRSGDRDVWCGLYRYPLEQAALDAPNQLYTGTIDRGSQHRLYPVGSCLGPDGEGLTSGTVPCDGPHVVEISGHVSLEGRVATAPTADQYGGLVGDACQRLGKAFAGRNYRDPVFGGWMLIEPSSWDAGKRVVHCTVAEYRNEEALTITRRLGPPTA